MMELGTVGALSLSVVSSVSIVVCNKFLISTLGARSSHGVKSWLETQQYCGRKRTSTIMTAPPLYVGFVWPRTCSSPQRAKPV
jgi:hypothetical protein